MDLGHEVRSVLGVECFALLGDVELAAWAGLSWRLYGFLCGFSAVSLRFLYGFSAVSAPWQSCTKNTLHISIHNCLARHPNRPNGVTPRGSLLTIWHQKQSRATPHARTRNSHEILIDLIVPIAPLFLFPFQGRNGRNGRNETAPKKKNVATALGQRPQGASSPRPDASVWQVAYVASFSMNRCSLRDEKG